MASSLLFRAATVVDGTGHDRFQADVVVRDGRIARVARAGSGVEPEAGHDVVDAAGLVLAPGFIDMHAHSDLAVLADPAHVAKVSQGVTTEVLGQDGIGYAPVDDSVLPGIRTQIAGWNGHPGMPVPWRTMSDYLDVLATGTAANTAVLVPQGNLRMLTVGHESRRPSAAEQDRMGGLLDDALAAGAVGMSSGLTYAPGMYADEEELTALCRVVAARGGYWAPHTRSYGAGALDAYTEAIRIARNAGCALHLTHATLNFASNADAAPAFLALVDRAIADGLDLTLDTYPYLPGATTLASLLPSWMSDGGPDAMLDRLASGAHRAALADALAAGSDGFHGEPADWSAIAISGVGDPALREHVGRTIAEIADADGVAPVDAVVRILLADRLATGVLMHVGHERNVQAIMRHPAHCAGSDGILVGDRPHPRAWGTFPRYLGRYVRELGVLTLEEAVRHLSATPARRLGLGDRGLVEEGRAADLVLFDPATVHDTATFAEPRQVARGIHVVVVNGAVAWRDGERTDAVAGRVLRAGRGAVG